MSSVELSKPLLNNKYDSGDIGMERHSSFGRNLSFGHDLAMSFKDITISTFDSPKPILANVSGFVAKGGLTAVLGASGSGKSVLMRALAGLLQDFIITGDFRVNGVPADPKDISNSISYVPQTDDALLIGDLSAYEMLMNASRMKSSAPIETLEAETNKLLEEFGLGHVAKNPIGTVFARGLSGGQKRRVTVCTELVCAPSLIMLDEPTSGLDGALAFDVINVIKKRLAAKDGSLACMISIHQPNSRILELFDHIMITGSNGNIFFGTVPDLLAYFAGISFPHPKEYTPTDFFLQIIDSNYDTGKDFDFLRSFQESKYYQDLTNFLNGAQSNAPVAYEDQYELRTGKKRPTFADEWSDFKRQFGVLVYREYTLAKRDPSLYYLQVVLCFLFLFTIGGAFYHVAYLIADQVVNCMGSLFWLITSIAYLQNFKIFHLSKQNIRYKYDITNNTYSVMACWCAELFTTAVFHSMFLPFVLMSYGMMGYPNKRMPFTIFLVWTVGLTSESMVYVVSKLCADPTSAIILAMAIEILLTTYGSGTFMYWNDTPYYWDWLKKISYFFQSAQALMINVFDAITFKCDLSYNYTVCLDNTGFEYPCNEGYNDDHTKCHVGGRKVLWVTNGLDERELMWKPWGYLFIMFVIYRAILLFLMVYPKEVIYFKVRSLLGYEPREEIMSDARQQNPLTDKVASEGEDRSQGLVKNDDRHAYLAWTNLSVILKKGGAKLIDDVDGVAHSGRVLALMGPSGAGKTTLLNALGKRAPYANVTGEVHFGSRNFFASDLVYVPQFDDFCGVMTVFEQLEFVGLMKCRDVTAMRTRLFRLLTVLGLQAKSSYMCQTLTGGELKRVSVGKGMVSDPNVLFVDEPTTGLDSTAAFSLVTYLVAMAENTGVAVIMTIHQPAQMVFDMLQDLYLLESGRLAYNGPLSETKKYFAGYSYVCPEGINAADFYLDLVSNPPSETKSWRNLFDASDLGKKVTKEQRELIASTVDKTPLADPVPSDWVRFREMCIFFSKYYHREPGCYWTRLMFQIFCGIYIGTLFYDLTPDSDQVPIYNGCIFMNMWAAVVVTASGAGLLEIEQRISFEQVANGVVTPTVYCLAQFLVSIPFNLVGSTVYMVSAHNLSRLQPTWECFIYSILLSLGLYLFIEAFLVVNMQVLKSAMLTVNVLLVNSGGFFLFSGVFIPIDDMPPAISWLAYPNPLHYAYDGYAYEVFDTRNYYVKRSDSWLEGSDVLDKVIKQKDYVKPWPWLLIFYAFIVFFRLQHVLVFREQVWPFLVDLEEAKKAK